MTRATRRMSARRVLGSPSTSIRVGHLPRSMLPSSCARSLCLAPFQVPMRSTWHRECRPRHTAQLALHGKAGRGVGAGQVGCRRRAGGAPGPSSPSRTRRRGSSIVNLHLGRQQAALHAGGQVVRKWRCSSGSWRPGGCRYMASKATLVGSTTVPVRFSSAMKRAACARRPASTHVPCRLAA